MRSIETAQAMLRDKNEELGKAWHTMNRSWPRGGTVREYITGYEYDRQLFLNLLIDHLDAHPDIDNDECWECESSAMAMDSLEYDISVLETTNEELRQQLSEAQHKLEWILHR